MFTRGYPFFNGEYDSHGPNKSLVPKVPLILTHGTHAAIIGQTPWTVRRKSTQQAHNFWHKHVGNIYDLHQTHVYSLKYMCTYAILLIYIHIDIILHIIYIYNYIYMCIRGVFHGEIAYMWVILWGTCIVRFFQSSNLRCLLNRYRASFESDRTPWNSLCQACTKNSSDGYQT